MAGQRKALIIANDTYEQEALGDLLAPAADAEALGRVLGDPQIGDFAVQVVHNESAHVRPTRRALGHGSCGQPCSPLATKAPRPGAGAA